MKNFEKIALVFSLIVLFFSYFADQQQLKTKNRWYKDSLSGIWTASIYSPTGAEIPLLRQMQFMVDQQTVSGKVQQQEILEGKINLFQ